ncbi:hypothetical protein ACFQJD_06685 [Haloplanus sp. GCM10025708]|uniref:DUF7502 family protein n=1 Tax=Haloplanus sp. GCM10025708 TaxID=3252679 RepID=UPI00361E7AB0
MNDETAAPRMRRAIRQIRREGYKIAVVYAVVDAAVATLLSNLLLQILDVPVVPERLPLPDVVVTALERVGVALSDPTVAAASVVGVVVGLLVFAAEAVIRARRPLVEQFEAANPDVREALRTARDAVEDGLKNRIARSLYEDVLDELRHASSVGLLDVRRVAVTLALVIALSFVNIQVAVVDVSIGGFDGSATPSPTATGSRRTPACRTAVRSSAIRRTSPPATTNWRRASRRAGTAPATRATSRARTTPADSPRVEPSRASRRASRRPNGSKTRN